MYWCPCWCCGVSALDVSMAATITRSTKYMMIIEEQGTHHTAAIVRRNRCHTAHRAAARP